jgi:hypothetical protein
LPPRAASDDSDTTPHRSFIHTGIHHPSPRPSPDLSLRAPTSPSTSLPPALLPPYARFSLAPAKPFSLLSLFLHSNASFATTPLAFEMLYDMMLGGLPEGWVEQPILMIFVIFFNVLVFLTMVRCRAAYVHARVLLRARRNRGDGKGQRGNSACLASSAFRAGFALVVSCRASADVRALSLCCHPAACDLCSPMYLPPRRASLHRIPSSSFPSFPSSSSSSSSISSSPSSSTLTQSSTRK